MIVKERHNKENMTVTCYSDDGSSRVWQGFTEYVGQRFMPNQVLAVLFVEDSHECWVLDGADAFMDLMRYWADSQNLSIRRYAIFSPFEAFIER